MPISNNKTNAPNGFYVYLHRKASNGQVFYVGKGLNGRAWTRKNRNRYWHNVVAKHGFIVEIVIEGLQEWAALELEMDYIALYGRKDLGHGELINLTDGGDSPPHSSESIAAGVATRENNPEYCAKRLARIRAMHSTEEWREKFQKMMKNRATSDSWLENLRRSLERRTANEEWREAVKKARANQTNNPKWVSAVQGACNKPVECVEMGIVFASGAEAVKWLGVPNRKTAANGISRACRTPGATSYGYHWRFTNNPTEQS